MDSEIVRVMENAAGVNQGEEIPGEDNSLSRIAGLDRVRSRARHRFAREGGTLQICEASVKSGCLHAETYWNSFGNPADGTRKEEGKTMTKIKMAMQDPVCGMDIESNTSAGNTEHMGQTYHFCSLACKQKFDHHPEQYLGKAGTVVDHLKK